MAGCQDAELQQNQAAGVWGLVDGLPTWLLPFSPLLAPTGRYEIIREFLQLGYDVLLRWVGSGWVGLDRCRRCQAWTAASGAPGVGKL